MLYHCLRRWPNIKTTLRRRFVFDAITTVSSMVKCRRWPHIETLLDIGLCILIDKMYRVQVCLSPLTMGAFIDWPRFMDFSRHVHHCTNINPHSDPENTE